MALSLFVSSSAFAPQHLAVPTQAQPAVRMSGPVMSEPTQTRRAALLGLASAAIPAAASASAIWQTGPYKHDLGPPTAAKKCTVEKPCTAGAGLKWDPVALGVKKAETRKCTSTALCCIALFRILALLPYFNRADHFAVRALACFCGSREEVDRPLSMAMATLRPPF
jgi:hypothetical protein